MPSAVCQPERISASRRSRRPPRPPEPDTSGGAALPYDAVLFNVDGVVVDSATVLAVAWKRLFDAVMAGGV